MAIDTLKLFAAASMPVMYTYTLYYLRGFDSFNFYTQMIFNIMSDMVYFAAIMIWLLLSLVLGMYAMQVV